MTRPVAPSDGLVVSSSSLLVVSSQLLTVSTLSYEKFRTLSKLVFVKVESCTYVGNEMGGQELLKR